MTILDRVFSYICQPINVLRLSGLGMCVLNAAGALLEAVGAMRQSDHNLATLLYTAWFAEQPPLPAAALLQLLLNLVFVLGYWRMTAPPRLQRRTPRMLGPLLALDAVAALISPLPVVVTALAAIVLPVRHAMGFLLLQVVLSWVQVVLLPAPLELESWAETGLPLWVNHAGLLLALAALYGLAFSLGWMVADEHERRRLLQSVNAELASQEQLQAEQVRFAERLQMTRDLHDLMGHHLAALNLSLQLANELHERGEFGRAREPLAKARQAAQRLLDDVRNTVSVTRERRRIDLSSALHELSARIEQPRIVIEIDEAARDLPPRVANAVLRCVQEAVTNAVRHAQASTVHIRIACRDGRLAVTASDDGMGTQALRHGSGLAGMRERMAELGGELRVLCSHPGFSIELSCPCET